MSADSVSFSHQVHTYVIAPAYRAQAQIQGHWKELGKKVELWADTSIQKPWNDVAKKIFHSSYIAATLFMSSFKLAVVATGVYYIANAAYGPFSNETHELVYQGATVGLAAKSVYNLAALVATWNPVYAFKTAVYACGALYLLPYAKLLPVVSGANQAAN
ncbi:MAG: hypothetical protein LLF94_12045 [Chlamydiales bacterium]|nr:hypothetical protein [Chlamydiales bacterium]